ncbi:energy transducer TonB [Yunchengibacter salinarum]|uniref:energy transducer TonB n=1 Tax=Yunchengibacter salinarum TaxID=3133399 RepID=UPI0035B5EE03
MKQFILAVKRGLVATGLIMMATSGAVHANAVQDWAKGVMQKVASEQRYPRSALMREIEGRAEVKVTVSADGTIVSHEVTTPTGEAVLDREIPRLVERISPLKPLPDGRDSLTFTMPLAWSLQ